MKFAQLVLLAFVLLGVWAAQASDNDDLKLHFSLIREKQRLSAINRPLAKELLETKSQIIGIELLSSSPGKDLTSRFGHLLLRFVGSSRSGQQDIVVSFAALTPQSGLDPWLAVDGSYPMAIQLEKMHRVQDRYAKAMQNLRRVIIPSTLQQRMQLIENVIHYAQYSRSYKFFSANCATELLNLLYRNKVLLPIGGSLPSTQLINVVASGQSPYPPIPLKSGLVKLFSWMNKQPKSRRPNHWPAGAAAFFSTLSDQEKIQVFVAVNTLPSPLYDDAQNALQKYKNLPLWKKSAIATGMLPVPRIVYQTCDNEICAKQIAEFFPKLWNTNTTRKLLYSSYVNAKIRIKNPAYAQRPGFLTTQNVLKTYFPGIH